MPIKLEDYLLTERLLSSEEATTCSTPAVSNSVSSTGDVSVHRVGDNVTFTCSQGFQLDGAQQITCGPDGQWQPQPPRCLPAPDKTQLPEEESELVLLLDSSLCIFWQYGKVSPSQFCKRRQEIFCLFFLSGKSAQQVDVAYQ